MKTLITRLLLILTALVASCDPVRADSLVTLSVTITSAPTNGASLTVNGSTRTWATSVSTPATQISVTNSIGPAATNLYAHIGSYPLPGPLALGFGSSNIITLRGGLNQSISASIVGTWATLAWATNTTATSLITVRVPASAESVNVRRYVADEIVRSLQVNALTNRITNGAPLLVDYVSRQETQTISGPKAFTGGITASGLTATGIVNRGTAISSPGSATGSEQFGGLAAAGGTNALAVGRQAVATETDSLAVGSAAEAGGSGATAVGRAALASAADAVAVGSGTSVSGLRAIGIGTSAAATGMDSVVIGKSASDAGHSNSVAIGTGATSTGPWDFILGGASHLVRIPGRILSATLTNATLHGTISILSGGLVTGATVSNALVYATGGLLSGVTITNAAIHATSGTLSAATLTGGTVTNSTVRASTMADTTTVTGQWRWEMTTSSSLANGINSGVYPGAGVYLKITSGPTGSFTIAGISGGGAGRLLALYNATGQIMTLANESGSEATTANRIRTLSGLDVTTTGSSLMWLLYDASISRWVVTSLSGVTVAGNTNLWTVKGANVLPGNIADSANVTWTVTGTNITATLTNAVTSVNGLQGAVTVVTSYMGLTGDVLGPTWTQHQTWYGTNIFEGNFMAWGTGTESTRIARGATASGTRSVGIGYEVTASGYAALAVGHQSLASAEGTVAIGNGAEASSMDSISIGSSAGQVGVQAVSIGTTSQAVGINAVALGAGAIANYDESVALGYYATASATNQIRLGRSSETVSVPGRISVAGGIDVISGVPANPPASTGRLYVTTNGGGKLQLITRWPDGSTNIVATQP